MTKIDLKLALKQGYETYKGPLAFGFFLMLYLSIRVMLNAADPASVAALESIWLLVATSILTFLGLLGLCWWILQKTWFALGLPDVINLIGNFENLELWQQLSFYLAFFALLLSAAVTCLLAIC